MLFLKELEEITPLIYPISKINNFQAIFAKIISPVFYSYGNHSIIELSFHCGLELDQAYRGRDSSNPERKLHK